jgi:hypothetical protein
MRSSPRPHSLFHRVFAALLFAAFACVAADSRAQAPAHAAPPVSPFPPMLWDDKLRDLAAEIARLAPPPAKMDLLVSNVSSLSPEEVAPIRDALKAQLANQGLRSSNSESADASIRVTISEGFEGYVVVAQVRRNSNEQVAIVTVERGVKSAPRSGGVTLDAKLVWQQRGVMLDFALPGSATANPDTMAVLEPTRLVFYSRRQSQWIFARELDSESARSSRDWHGYIDLSQGPAKGDARWPLNECKGDFTQSATIECNVVEDATDSWISGGVRPPFAPGMAGDVVSVASQCRAHPVALETAAGDWTQLDSLQGYEIVTGPGHGAMASGNPVEFDGPVTAIWPAGAPGVARAVVHNLQTGNYEAYLVTATCSQ